MDYEILELTNLKQAEEEIAKINCNPIGARIMAFKTINLSLKLKAVEPKTANLIKQEMLSRGGDVAVSRKVGAFSKENTDIIVIGNLAQFVRLVRKMNHQTAFDCKKITEKINQILLKEFNIDVQNVEVW